MSNKKSKFEPKKELTVQDVKQIKDDREVRCKPIVRKILEILRDEEILLGDVSYIQQVVYEHIQGMVKDITIQHAQTVFDLIQQTLQYHVNTAMDILWEKEKDEVTAKDVDDVLKSAIQLEQESK